MRKIFRKYNYNGINLNIFDVEEIELTPLSQSLDTDTFTREIRVRTGKKWSRITLFGKTRKATKIREINTWE